MNIGNIDYFPIIQINTNTLVLKRFQSQFHIKATFFFSVLEVAILFEFPISLTRQTHSLCRLLFPRQANIGFLYVT